MDYLSLGFNGPGGPSFVDPSSYDPFYDPTFDPVYVSGGNANQYPTYSDGIYSPPITGPDRRVQVQSPWPQLIAADIAAGLKTISNIFAPASATAAQALAQQQQGYYGAYRPGTYQGTTPGSSTSAGFDSSGINLFGSHIGWWPIAIVALGFYLLQSRPVGRR